MNTSLKILNVVIILATMLYSSHFSFSKSSFSQEKIRMACNNFIIEKLGDDAVVSLPKVIAPQEFNEDNVSANIVTEIDNLLGNIPLKIEFRKNGTLLRYIEIPVRIKLYKNVVVANQSVVSGDVLDDRNLTIERREVTNFREEYFYSKNSLKGFKAKRNIAKGNIITKTFINLGNSIKRGDKVTLIVQSGAVKIKTTGIALQDSEIGEILRVKREGTQGVFQGKINNDGTVIINLN